MPASTSAQEDLAAASSIVNAIIAGAIEQRASDIHIEATERETIVRYRVDGALRQVETQADRAPPRDRRRASRCSRSSTSRSTTRRRTVGSSCRRPPATSICASRCCRRTGARRSCAACSTTRRAVAAARALGFEPAQRDEFLKMIARAVRPGARHRPDRLGQEHDAVCGAQRRARSRGQRRHRRGSGRVSDRRHQPGAGRAQARPDVRERAALDPAPGSRRHPRRRDPRSRDRRARRRGRADRSPRAHLAAHERRVELDHAADRARRRAVPRRAVAARHRRAAADAHASARRAASCYTPDAAELATLGLPSVPAGTQVARGRGCSRVPSAPATAVAPRSASCSRSTTSCAR